MAAFHRADFGLAVNSQEERPVTRLGTLDYMVRFNHNLLKCSFDVQQHVHQCTHNRLSSLQSVLVRYRGAHVFLLQL